MDIEYYNQAMQIQAGHTDATVRVMNSWTPSRGWKRAAIFNRRLPPRCGTASAFCAALLMHCERCAALRKTSMFPPINSRAFAYLTQRLHYDSAAALEGALERTWDLPPGLWDP